MLMTEFRNHHPQLHHHLSSPCPLCLPLAPSPFCHGSALSWNGSQGAAPQDHSRLAHSSFMEGSWFSMTLVPNSRELGLQVGSRSHPFPRPHPPDWGEAGDSPLLRAGSSSPYGAGRHQLSPCIIRLQWALSASPQGESLPEG